MAVSRANRLHEFPLAGWPAQLLPSFKEVLVSTFARPPTSSALSRAPLEMRRLFTLRDMEPGLN